jgi:predicted metalloprotease with PDZ domain
VLAKSYFVVGQLHRWPSWDEETTTPGERPFCVYWVGDLPYDSDHVSAVAKKMHGAISSFFGDSSSPFRVFWRHKWVGYGGAGGHNSFMLEWADGTAEEQSEEALTFLLSHEAIHEYAPMHPKRNYDMWYREGVAQYYAVVAPFVGGAVDKGYLIRWLNNNLQAYYTGGTANMTWRSIVDLYRVCVLGSSAGVDSFWYEPSFRLYQH